jgi:hypothetical protein
MAYAATPRAFLVVSSHDPSPSPSPSPALFPSPVACPLLYCTAGRLRASAAALPVVRARRPSFRPSSVLAVVTAGPQDALLARRPAGQQSAPAVLPAGRLPRRPCPQKGASAPPSDPRQALPAHLMPFLFSSSSFPFLLVFELAASNSYCTSVHAPEQLIPSTETLRS